MVFGSSLYLFKEVKASLRRCLTFSRQKALFDLTVAFKNTLRLYSQLLKRRLPVKSGDQAVQLTDEQELACAHIVNTCEYCLETVPRLHNQIEDVIEGFEVDLQESATAPFRELINFAANALVRSISFKTEAVYTAQMQKINWLTFADVNEQKYMRDVFQIVKSKLAPIKEVLNPVYLNLVLNKLVSSLTSQYLA